MASKLRTKAVEEYEKCVSPLVTYDLELDPMFVRKHNPEENNLFASGDYIILADTDSFADASSKWNFMDN